MHTDLPIISLCLSKMKDLESIKDSNLKNYDQTDKRDFKEKSVNAGSKILKRPKKPKLLSVE